MPQAAVKQTGSDTCSHAVECFTLAWTFGMLSVFLHAGGWLIWLFPIFSIGIFCMRKQRKYRNYLLIAAIGLTCGSALRMYYEHAVQQPLCALDGTSAVCTGTVTDSDSRTGDRTVYTLRTSLSGIHTQIEWFADAGMQSLHIGDQVPLDAELSGIQPDFRYHTAMYQAGRGRYLRIYHANMLDYKADTSFSLSRILHAYRSTITDRIRRAIPPQEAGLFCAMLFGDKTMLTDETSDALQQAGIGHIVAVSGLHLVFFCGVLTWLLRRMQCPAKMIFLLQIPAIVLFIMLVDASVSVFRAAVMVLLTASAPLFGRYGNSLRSLCIAVLLCTAVSPYVIGAASFWLSVSGVLGIGIIAPYMTAHLTCSAPLKTFLQLCCTAAAVFPASVLLCGESSLLAPFCNLLILPVCTVVLYLGTFYVLTGGVLSFLMPAAAVLCRLIRMAADFAAKLPFSHVTVYRMPVRVTVIACTVLVCCTLLTACQPKRIAASALFSACLLTALHAVSILAERNDLHAAVLGSNTGAAMVITLEGHTVIADLSGTPRNAQYVRAYLEKTGISGAELLLCNAKTAAAYQAELSEYAIQSVVLSQASDFRSDETVCGQQPYQNADTAVQCGSAEIRYTDTAAEICWNGIRMIAQTQSEQLADADIRILTGKNGTVIQIGDTEYQENNLLLHITATGKASAAPL